MIRISLCLQNKANNLLKLLSDCNHLRLSYCVTFHIIFFQNLWSLRNSACRLQCMTCLNTLTTTIKVLLSDTNHEASNKRRETVWILSFFKMFYGCWGSFCSFLNISKFKLYGTFYGTEKMWEMAYGSQAHVHLSDVWFRIPSREPPGFWALSELLDTASWSWKEHQVEWRTRRTWLSLVYLTHKRRTEIGEALAVTANAVCKNWFCVTRGSGISIFASFQGLRRAHMILI